MASSKSNRRGGQNKGGARRNELNKLYANPLPLHAVLNPHCIGVFDPATRSVWVTGPKDTMILWRRGFFGKGDLSRSEPSWFARQINAKHAAATNQITSEEIREKRRAERKQFKLDRARAMAQAAAEAEAAFEEGREAAVTVIPSGATWRPQEHLHEPDQPEEPSNVQDKPEETEPDPVLEVEQEEELVNLEHLQLTLSEAFFLSWALDCLTILDPTTSEPFTLQDVWETFRNAYTSSLLNPLEPDIALRRLDNPFLVNYAVYHYYRSLGWVVKGGIKFCVDLLLYKRGPVFNHAEFAVVVIPVYEDPADKESSPFRLPNSEPFSWSWLSTINRVNSQVQKTLILTYVTIPSRLRLSSDLLASPACLAHYSVKEVVVRRFIPARMRD